METTRKIRKSWESSTEYGPEKTSVFISGMEALLLISLCFQGEKKLLTNEQIYALRQIIYLSEKKQTDGEYITFTENDLVEIERSLPTLGTVDEGIYSPFRVKLNKALLEFDTVLVDELKIKSMEEENEVHKVKHSS